MYSLLNQNIQELLAFIDFGEDIEPYLLLRQAIEHVDVSTAESFKRLYSDFWRMHGVFVGEDFIRGYFDYLQACKFLGTPEVEEWGCALVPDSNARGRVTFPTVFVRHEAGPHARSWVRILPAPRISWALRFTSCGSSVLPPLAE